MSLVFVSSEHFGDVTEEPRTIGTRSLSRGESGWGLALTTHPKYCRG